MQPSKANPMGKEWGELSFDQRRSVVAEKEKELARLKHNILYDDPYLVNTDVKENPFSSAQDAHANQAEGRAQPQAQVSQASAMENPRETERRYAGTIREALDAFLACPTGVNSQQVIRWFEAYQTAWMTGRKRVTVHE